MRLLIVIVNYKTAGLTIDCLQSLAVELQSNMQGITTQVVVTDNLSPDDSVAQLQDAVVQHQWQHWCSIMPLPANGGFAYGNNAAIRPALAAAEKPDLILLLNPDTVVRPGGIRNLVDYAVAHPACAISGSRLEDPDGTPQYSAFRFYKPFNDFENALQFGLVNRLFKSRLIALPIPNSVTDCDWVAGASMLIRREVFEKIGLLDEEYFMYFEEVDFCLRAKNAGFKCQYVPQSRIVHLVGQASGIVAGKPVRKRRPAYWYEARRRYFVTNFGRASGFLADVLFAIGYLPGNVLRLLRGKPNPHPKRMLLDVFAHSALTGNIPPRKIS
jgi:N-acetylglucosaminyl-diphospho-decaprenol L-rhamnosyltransferase